MIQGRVVSPPIVVEFINKNFPGKFWVLLTMSVSYIWVHQWVWKRKLDQYCEGFWIHHKQFFLNLMDNLESLKLESEVEIKAGKGYFGIWEWRTLEWWRLLEYVVNLNLSVSWDLTNLSPGTVIQGLLCWLLPSIVAYLDLHLCGGQFLVIMTILSYPWSRHGQVLSLVTKNTETLALS